MLWDPKEAASQVSKFFADHVQFFSGPRPLEDDVLNHFAPKGFQKIDGSSPKPGLPFLLVNPTSKSLKIQTPIDGVVWWRPSRLEGRIDALHLVPNGQYRILPFDDLVRALPMLGEGKALSQGHPLGDIPYEFVLSNPAPGSPKVIIHKAVWAGEVIGKVTEISIVWP